MRVTVDRLTYFPGRAKQEVSPEASMDGLAASRKVSNDPLRAPSFLCTLRQTDDRQYGGARHGGALNLFSGACETRWTGRHGWRDWAWAEQDSAAQWTYTSNGICQKANHRLSKRCRIAKAQKVSPEASMHGSTASRKTNYASPWTKIGAAFPQKEGTGFSIELRAFPIHGRLVVLPPDGDDNNRK